MTWHLGTDVKQFMPRLGAPIISITPCAHDPAKFVVTQANNAIRVVCLACAFCILSACVLKPRKYQLPSWPF